VSILLVAFESKIKNSIKLFNDKSSKKKMIRQQRRQWIVGMTVAMLVLLTDPCSAWSSHQSVTQLGSSSFLATPSTKKNPQSQRRRSLAASMVFERMSEDCIAALVTAQEEAKKLGLVEVGPEVMMAGIVGRPEAAKSTLLSYGITWRKVIKTLNEMYPAASPANADNTAFSFLKYQPKSSQDLLFSNKLKTSMVDASKIADKLGSASIHSQHVLLALLEFTGETAAKPVNGRIQCGGLAVLLRTDGLDDFEALDFCQALLDNIEQEEQGKLDKELALASGAAASSKTPTLADCGVDLTALARAGRLDPVYGRDDEIRSALRTLVRRRKNNPCLIGEPGVGKTAIAEGLAQILVNEKTCPPRLKGYRIVSLELASLVAGTKYRGEFEERLQNIIAEVINEESVPTILFIDEVHQLIGKYTIRDLFLLDGYACVVAKNTMGTKQQEPEVRETEIPWTLPIC
jgi:ATP-dependent Clp protease ATP-binding subunit ClpC